MMVTKLSYLVSLQAVASQVTEHFVAALLLPFAPDHLWARVRGYYWIWGARDGREEHREEMEFGWQESKAVLGFYTWNRVLMFSVDSRPLFSLLGPLFQEATHKGHSIWLSFN